MTKKPHPIDIIVGKNLCRLRNHAKNHAKMTQAELRRRIGVTFQQIQKYEKASNRIPASRLWDCALALGVPVETLFTVSLKG